jgi:hypothetical protein
MSSLPEQQHPNPKRQVPLGRLLVERGLLTEQELIQALLEQNRTGERIGKVLIRLGYVDEPTVAMALASQHGGPLKTEYGFATGFETDSPAEQVTEATLNPDPAAARPLAAELRASPVPSDAGDEPEPDPVSDPQEHEAPADTSSTEPDSTVPPEEDPADDDRAPSQVVPFTGSRSAHAELDSAHARIADVEQELAVAHIRIADVQRELAGAHTRIAELERQLDTAHTRSEELEPELEAANTRIAALEPELAAVQRQLDDQHAQIAALEATVASDRHAAETAIAALQEVAGES